MIGNDKQSLAIAYEDGEAPTVYVTTAQAELLLTKGEPQFEPLPGTTLSYVVNSADDIFRDGETPQNYYVLDRRTMVHRAVAPEWTVGVRARRQACLPPSP